jgi:hypothetical protein
MPRGPKRAGLQLMCRSVQVCSFSCRVLRFHHRSSAAAMGCCTGRQFILNELVPGQDSIALQTFEQLELSISDVNCFWRAFIDMDADDSGTIRSDEFFAYFNIENTGLNSKIFMTMDSDHSGYLNFCNILTLLSPPLPPLISF